MKENINNHEVASPERSGGDATSSENYDGEVRPRRRSFPRAVKEKILSEIDNCQTRGSIGLILRREGLYSSQIAQWRKSLNTKNSNSKKPASNGFKNENARLIRENNRLKAKLEKANKLLEIQKKMADLAEQLTEESLENNPAKSFKDTSEN